MTVLDWTGKERRPSAVVFLAAMVAQTVRLGGRFAWTPDAWQRDRSRRTVSA